MSARLALSVPFSPNLDPVPPHGLDPEQLQTALTDLCGHTFAIVEQRVHAQQLYATARDRRIPVRLPQRSSGGWRVELG